MPTISDLPTVNAILNASSFVFLLLGFIMIKKGNRRVHQFFMLTALTFSLLFLTSYLIYHARVGSVRFTGQGTIRLVYFTILISHTILAVVIVPLVIITLRRALKKTFTRHKKIARWLLPVWMYVSVTGVIIYLMLYQL